ncbi:hypothetical protein BLS_001584 [Venturia inaequalis]|uniref:Folliculin-interacting protein N-terminal domain-containing protein n=1 Tax=Venturia inaequalis TaxID=5025 RepID=A0A8H3UV47_VENIN|nr:hypothetical protein EG328_004409 [Venturia inaequalis]KAE9977176.1 hypothetical protein BLS_001584 [Venturia inaequalis]KAE9992742.1 hypothetical protein EG327_007965 [Venturia inaequalis]RDI78052.1 hypothetical protein Vi05172_g11996 [Venturia inaequalis]
MEGFGQLLSSLNPLKTRRSASDSAVDREHVMQLLFPNKVLISEKTKATIDDDCSHGDIDVQFPRDVRFLVAQAESASSLGPVLLFDSKEPQLPDPAQLKKTTRPGGRGDQTSTHTRTTSGSSRQLVRPPTVESIPEDEGRVSPTFAGSSISAIAHKNRMRRTSAPTTQKSTSSHPRLDEAVQIALTCMFDNVPSSYKGDSDNFKIYPVESTSPEPIKLDPPPAPNTRRPSHLSKVYSAADVGASARAENNDQQTKENVAIVGSPKASTVEDPKKLKIVTNESVAIIDPEDTKPKRRTVMVTRTFSVPWTSDDSTGKNAAVPKGPDGKPGPRPRPLPEGVSRAAPPMFSVTLLLDLPIIEKEVGYPLRRNSGSASLASSAGKEWNMLDPASFGLNNSNSIFETDVDSAVEEVTRKNWDIVIRTLSSLQKTALECLLPLLRQLPATGRPPRLLMHALAGNEPLKKATNAAGVRLVRGFHIPRVETGQRHWGQWRNEARLLEQWTDSRDKNFLFKLMNGFLGTHTEWLTVLAPMDCRSMIVYNQKQGPKVASEELAVPCRTVIVSSVATTSRRLVYLLSQFLPANKDAVRGSSRPGTAQSFNSFSRSPPTPHNAPSRNESLRRSTMKRQGNSYKSDGTKTPVASCPSSLSESRPGMTIRFEDQVPPSRSRPTSAGKGKSPIPDVPAKSTPTNATAPAYFAPVAYISGRPSSRDSVASENLMSALQRTSSSETQSSNRWASLKNFWNNSSSRRESECFDPLDNDEGLGITGAQHSENLRSKLQQMVQEGEAQLDRSTSLETAPTSASDTTSPVAPVTPEFVHPSAAAGDNSSSQPVDIPRKVEAKYNAEDGVIDVTVPFPSVPALSSPPFAGYYSAKASCRRDGQVQLLGWDPRESDHPQNVAGVLNSIHSDFALQAVAPYTDLLKDIKATMSAEPLPVSVTRQSSSYTETKDVWVEVSTTLIVDTRTMTITRLRLRRKVRFAQSTAKTSAPMPPVSRAKACPPKPLLKSQYGNPYRDAMVPAPTTLDEEFIEEIVNDRDAYLTHALERVLAHDARSPKVQSAFTSKASSRRGSVTGKENQTTVPSEVPHAACRVQLLSSLHEITNRVRQEQINEQQYGDHRLPVFRDENTSILRTGIEKWFTDVTKEYKAIQSALRKKEKEEQDWYNSEEMTARPSEQKKKTPPVFYTCSETDSTASGSTTPTAATPVEPSSLAPPPPNSLAQAGPSRSLMT